MDQATGTTGGEAGDAAPRIDKDTFIFIGDYERVWDDESAKTREDVSTCACKPSSRAHSVPFTSLFALSTQFDAGSCLLL